MALVDTKHEYYKWALAEAEADARRAMGTAAANLGAAASRPVTGLHTASVRSDLRAVEDALHKLDTARAAFAAVARAVIVTESDGDPRV